MPATPRRASDVSRALSRAGINVGYRFTDFGPVTSFGSKITEPGVVVTRTAHRNRYAESAYDPGHVRVFVVVPDNPTGSDEHPEVLATKVRIVEALSEAGLPARVRSGHVEVLDAKPGPPRLVLALDAVLREQGHVGPTAEHLAASVTDLLREPGFGTAAYRRAGAASPDAFDQALRAIIDTLTEETAP